MTKRGLFASKVRFTPRDPVPGRGADAALRCGVGETVDLDIAPPCNAADTWAITSGGGTLVGAGAAAVYTCPDVPAGQITGRVVLSFGGNKAVIEFDVTAPTSGDLVKLSDIHKFSNLQPALNEPNSGFFGRHILGPVDVSFKGIQLREGLGTNQGTGVFQDLDGTAHTWSDDWIPAANVPVTDKGTIFGWDEVFTPANGAYAWDAQHHDRVGWADWPINWHYKLPADPSQEGRLFTTVHHRAWAYADGRVCVQKGTPYHWASLADPMVYDHPLNSGLNLRGQWVVV